MNLQLFGIEINVNKFVMCKCIIVAILGLFGKKFVYEPILDLIKQRKRYEIYKLICSYEIFDVYQGCTMKESSTNYLNCSIKCDKWFSIKNEFKNNKNAIAKKIVEITYCSIFILVVLYCLIL